ncbi:serine/threonine-protein kinase Chk2-like [Strongylocentrotus purpuratus]|uniref:Serine/threonine-protein kinase Chk2 n=1 Tax=Strongylocentrotus purpuratus TaxID=7668 RepID=A0A7M7N7F3_STRPU|nr:serine/threonine-protein kinase Chk2-like [Strongylocentrotus purpuratus]
MYESDMSTASAGGSASSSSIEPNSTSSASASLSSAGTLSSMETIPTQEVAEGDFDFAEERVVVWGRLYPVGKCFSSIDFLDTKDEYIFGRDPSCDVCYNGPEISKNPCYQTLSKTHFRIFKESNDNCNFYFIEDKSSNGTFVNGEKIGKGKKQVLNNNDEIALSLSKNKAYVFMDTKDSDQSNLPVALREKFIMSKVLGRGACGQVKLAFEKGTCRKVAVKIIEKKTFSIGGTMVRNMEKTVMEEVRILKRLHHPCIIGIEDVCDTPEVLYIVLELVESGELFDRVVSLGKFDEATAKFYFYQMITACKYLHDNGITHRDLKPENLLLMSDDKETILKVTDFGLSKFVGEQSLMKTLCGTPTYLAPEILTSMGMGGYTKAVDCWSIGVILYICLAGYPPFSDEIKAMNLDEQIKRGYYSFPTKYWGSVSAPAIDMVKKLLTVDPKRRLTTKQALAHPWLQDQEVIDKAEKVMYPNRNGQMLPPSAPVPGIKKRPRESAMSTDDEHCDDSGIGCMSSRKMSRSDDSGDGAFDKTEDVSKVVAKVAAKVAAGGDA